MFVTFCQRKWLRDPLVDFTQWLKKVTQWLHEQFCITSTKMQLRHSHLCIMYLYTNICICKTFFAITGLFCKPLTDMEEDYVQSKLKNYVIYCCYNSRRKKQAALRPMRKTEQWNEMAISWAWVWIRGIITLQIKKMILLICLVTQATMWITQLV